jgi:FG-GAP repeat
MSISESIEYFPVFDPETTNDSPGVSAAIGSGIAAVGTPDALGGGGAVVLYLYSATKNAWGYVGVLTGSKIAGSDQVRGLGSCVVAFGDTVVVGAPGDAGTAGRVFVLRPAYGAWSYASLPVVTELTAREPAKGDLFGTSVAHCSDGSADYIAVGAPGAAAPRGVSAPGQVYIFRGFDAPGTPWSTSPIANPNPEGTATDLFGASVAINPSGDGSNQWDGTLTIAVGAPGNHEGEGAVYVGRTTQPGAWTSPFRFGPALVPSFPEADDEFRTSGFGTAIALSGGVTLAVGSPNDPNFDAMIEGTGAVWIFNYTDGAFAANEAGIRLYGSAEGRMFGSTLAFPETSPSDVGKEKYALPQAEHLVVGAPGLVAGEPASAYRYVNELVDGNPTGATFTEDAQFVNSAREEGDRFATAVAASTSEYGAWCLVGSPGNAKAGQDGGGYLYVDQDPPPTWMDPPVLVTTQALRWGGMPPDWWKKFTPQIPKYLS